jgi:hypothetical protein
VHDVEIGHLVPAADVVGLAHAACSSTRGWRCNGRNVKPVAHVHAVAVDRQRFAASGVEDHQRNELFRELVGTVVVGAVGGQHRQAVGVVIGAHQMVAAALLAEYGLLGSQTAFLGEGASSLPSEP